MSKRRMSPAMLVQAPLAGSNNPFKESQLGFRLWNDGWRPVQWHDCRKCGARVKVKFQAGKTQACGQCKTEFNPLWEHDQYPDPLPAYTVWAKMVSRQWAIDIEKTDMAWLADLKPEPKSTAKKWSNPIQHDTLEYDGYDADEQMEEES